MSATQSPVYLYILMRTDVPTMNPGKAVAQGSHAANQCVHEIRRAERVIGGDDGRDGAEARRRADLLAEWEDETNDGFGTCIVLGVNETQMRDAVWSAQAAGVHAGITHDPSYPTGTPGSKHRSRPGAAAPVMFMWAVFFMVLGLFNPVHHPMPLLLGGLFFALLGWLMLIAGIASGAKRDQHKANTPALIPLDTCGFVFGRKDECAPHVGAFNLMP